MGRALRQGQKREVKLYRFLTLNTIDVDIMEARTSKKVVCCGSGQWELKDAERLTEHEEETTYGTVIGRDFLPTRMNEGEEEDG